MLVFLVIMGEEKAGDTVAPVAADVAAFWASCSCLVPCFSRRSCYRAFFVFFLTVPLSLVLVAVPSLPVFLLLSVHLYFSFLVCLPLLQFCGAFCLSWCFPFFLRSTTRYLLLLLHLLLFQLCCLEFFLYFFFLALCFITSLCHGC